MTLTPPYPTPLLAVARRVVWYDTPEQSLSDMPTFLAHVMVYGSPADVSVVREWVPESEFQAVLESAPAGVYTADAWRKWREWFGLPERPLPRRRFPDGSEGPEAGTFLGR